MDAERFTDIFSRLNTKLRQVARYIVGNEEEADDAVQDVFCTLWKKRDAVADGSGLEKMINVSVRNRSITGLRQRKRFVDTAETEDVLQSAVDSEPPDDTPDELYREIRGIIDQRLSQRDREILLLRDYSGWDFEDLAEKFDMTPAAVRMALSRARRMVLQVYRERQKGL